MPLSDKGMRCYTQTPQSLSAYIIPEVRAALEGCKEMIRPLSVEVRVERLHLELDEEVSRRKCLLEASVGSGFA